MTDISGLPNSQYLIDLEGSSNSHSLVEWQTYQQHVLWGRTLLPGPVHPAANLQVPMCGGCELAGGSISQTAPAS
jgi:hypothetical protein